MKTNICAAAATPIVAAFCIQGKDSAPPARQIRHIGFCFNEVAPALLGDASTSPPGGAAMLTMRSRMLIAH